MTTKRRPAQHFAIVIYRNGEVHGCAHLMKTGEIVLAKPGQFDRGVTIFCAKDTAMRAIHRAALMDQNQKRGKKRNIFDMIEWAYDVVSCQYYVAQTEQGKRGQRGAGTTNKRSAYIPSEEGESD